jgi:hypothetical protein
MTATPPIVDRETWQKQIDTQRVRENAHTREGTRLPRLAGHGFQQWLTGLDTGTPTTVDLPVPAPPALDVVARVVQPVNDVERVPTRRLEPCRRAGRERDAGLGARRPTRARSSRAGS